VVTRAMSKAPEDRYASAREFRDALQSAVPPLAVPGSGRQRSLAAVAVLVLVAAGALILLQLRQARGERALLAAQSLALVEELVEQGRYVEALERAEQVEAEFPEDTTLARLLPTFTFTVPIRTEPAGARVYLQRMDGPEDVWEDLGQTPLEGVRFAGEIHQLIGREPSYLSELPVRLRFELTGYEDRELYLTVVTGASWAGQPPMNPVVLEVADSSTAGMVRIADFVRDGVRYAGFWVDRFEVTNREFKEFVDAGGYRRADLWEHPFLVEGGALSFEEAMALLEDRTGRPGPSTWSLGEFPEGQAEFPVGGVSWHEAAAYARWKGKDLPTAVQWDQANLYYSEYSAVIVPNSNLDLEGPRPVGMGRAMSAYGIYDLIGNVREWCFNQVGAERHQRATRGGAWSDPQYLVLNVVPKDAFDRNETNGIRLIRNVDPDSVVASLRLPVQRSTARDYSLEKPVGEAEFQIFKRLHDYDPMTLGAVVEKVDTFPRWIREHVTYELPYGERGGVFLYLPRDAPRPLPSVVFWGGSGLLIMKSVEDEFLPWCEFLVRSGRAVAVPIFTGAYGRVDPRPRAAWGTTVAPGPSGANAYREISIRWVQDARAAVDYLETRADLNASQLGFLGYSFGGRAGPGLLAVDPRFDAAVLVAGGLPTTRYPPEVDPLNFAGRVRLPVLMLNGEYDNVFPYETSQRPLFELLGTPAEHKAQVLVRASHVVPQNELIKNTLDWFDKYLGSPAGP
jgi:dienelactone hydrolase